MTQNLKAKYLHFLLFSCFAFASTIALGGNWGAIGVSAFVIREMDPLLQRDGYFEKITGSHGRYFGISRTSAITRYSNFDISFGLSQVFFQKETQGIFPETNQYGILYASTESNYWCVPLSIQRSIIYKNGFGYNFRITYTPSILGPTITSLVGLGGADSSNYFSEYSDKPQSFRHGLQFAFSHAFKLTRGSTIDIAPWFEIGSAYYKSLGKSPGSICFGVDVHFRFKLPRIEIEWVKDPKTNSQKEQLKKKQKEIEEQLKNKPK